MFGKGMPQGSVPCPTLSKQSAKIVITKKNKKKTAHTCKTKHRT